MPAYPKSGPVTLRTNLADYPMTKALKSGAITSDLVTFDFCGPKVANQGFKRMLLDGEIDGGILGVENVDDPRVAPLIPNPKEAARAWHRKYNTVPVNHLFCVDKDLADTRPDVIAEIFRMLKESKAAMPPSPDGIDFHPFGVEALRKPLYMIMQYSVEQKITPRAFKMEELFDDATRGLA